MVTKNSNALGLTTINFLDLDVVTGGGAGDLISTNNLSDVANAPTSFGNIKQAATTTTTGVVEKSTSAENVAGTSNTVYPTVAGTKEMIATHASGISAGEAIGYVIALS